MLVSSFRDGVYVAVDTLRADRREGLAGQVEWVRIAPPQGQVAPLRIVDPA